MNNVFRCCAAILALAALAMPARAQPAPVFDWSGFYAGISGGWVQADTQWSQLNSMEWSGNGSLIGATIGANWQSGRLVFGVEGDLSAANVTATMPVNCFPISCNSELEWLATLRARAGVTLTPSWLLYATAGLAVGGVHHFFPGALSVRETQAGWTAGAGSEVMISSSWTARIEYLYTDLGEATVCNTALCVTAITADHFRTHTVRLGLNYRFVTY